MKISIANILLFAITTIESVSSFDYSCLNNKLLAKNRSFTKLLGGSSESSYSRKERKTLEERHEYERRRKLWLERYGSVEALQKTFGVAPIFGDLSPEQTRRLYHTLLPRSLLGLHEMGIMNPEELAPLAYNARIAAKEYARSRCVITGRLMTAAFDLYRGRLFGKSSSMSWEELYRKYEAQIVEEECADELNNCPSDEDLTMRIYLRILERSCSTNQAFDALFLNEDEDDDDHYLNSIASKLENDVRFLLLSSNIQVKAEKVEKKLQKQEEKDVKKQQKLEKKKAKKLQKAERKRLKPKANKNDKNIIIHDASAAATNEKDGEKEDKHVRSKRWTILRILAGTRRKKVAPK